MNDLKKVDLIVEKMTDMLRQYGYECRFKNKDESSDRYVLINFHREIPKGQLAFLITDLEISLKFWRHEDEIVTDQVIVHVRYNHHSGGSNGVSREYLVIWNDRGVILTGETLTVDLLIPFHDVNKIRDYFRRVDDSR